VSTLGVDPGPGPATIDPDVYGPWSLPDPEVLRAYLAALHLHEGRHRFLPRIVTVASPAAGSDWSVAVDQGRCWIPLTIRAQLVSSATVANRVPVLQYGDGTTTVVGVPSQNSQAASLTNRHGWARGAGNGPVGAGLLDFLASLPFHALFGGLVIQTVTTNLQVGDQWSAIALLVAQFEERQLGERAQALEQYVEGAKADLYPAFTLGF
jgi:hypothetical protein